jgi:hypothetical protein
VKKRIAHSRGARNFRSQRQTSVAGTYTFHFDGFSVFPTDAQNPPYVPFYIVGIGRINLKADGTLTGSQTSSTTPLINSAAYPTQILVCEYALDGSYTVNIGQGIGTASIHFLPSDPSKCGEETGTFSLVFSGPDGFWAISTGAERAPGGQKVDEVVRIEAVRVN